MDRDINPAIGTIPLTRLRADPLDGLYESLATTGGRAGGGLGPETIHEVHVIIRACIDEAVHTRLVAHIVAHWRRSRTVELANHQPGVTIDANSWTVDGPARSRATRPPRESLASPSRPPTATADNPPGDANRHETRINQHPKRWLMRH